MQITDRLDNKKIVLLLNAVTMVIALTGGINGKAATMLLCLEAAGLALYGFFILLGAWTAASPDIRQSCMIKALSCLAGCVLLNIFLALVGIKIYHVPVPFR